MDKIQLEADTSSICDTLVSPLFGHTSIEYNQKPVEIEKTIQHNTASPLFGALAEEVKPKPGL